MLNFEYQNQTRIVFGKGTYNEIGDRIKKYAGRVLLHYGGGSIKRSGLYDAVMASLKKSGVEVFELGGAVPNPRLSLVHEGIALCRKNDIGFILGVGGGSAIDSAKAIAMGVPYDGDVWDFYAAGKLPEKALPVACILTLPATGSESSISSVITHNGRKLGCNNPVIRPVFSIVDPELFYTLPPEQVANGACDIMSHAMERYMTNVQRTDLVDGYCEVTMKTVMASALTLHYDPKNYDAWCEFALSGIMAHNGQMGMGRQDDWASHKMEQELSAKYDVAHGAGLAVVIPAWMRYVYRENIPMFTQFAQRVMGVETAPRDPEALILTGIQRLKAFYREMGLPTTMAELGAKCEDYEDMAKRATKILFGDEMPIGGIKKLRWQDVVEIYKLAE